LSGFAAVAAVVVSLITGAPARAGLIINVAYGAGVPAAAVTDFNNLIATYEGAFANDITVNLAVNWGAASLGESSTLEYYESYSAWNAALGNDSRANPGNLYLTAGVASLPASDPIGNGTVLVRSAEAKALGLVNPNGGTTPDSTLTFSSTANFEYTGVATPNAYDFADVAAHELDEALGIGSALTGIPNNAAPPACASKGTSGTCYEAEDFFRYSAPGTRDLTTDPTAVVYFSYNGGTTSVAQFNQDNNAGGGAGADRNDWIYGNGGCPAAAPGPYIQDAIGCPNEAIAVGQAGSPEFIALDTLGYDAAPEPASILLFIGGICCLGALRAAGKVL
jgi:hypothetical protein